MEIIRLLFLKQSLPEEKEFGQSRVLKIDQPSAFCIELSYEGHQGENIHGA